MGNNKPPITQPDDVVAMLLLEADHGEEKDVSMRKVNAKLRLLKAQFRKSAKECRAAADEPVGCGDGWFPSSQNRRDADSSLLGKAVAFDRAAECVQELMDDISGVV